ERIRAILMAGDFRYLILPQGTTGALVLRCAGRLVDSAPAYQDAYFAVYRLPVSPRGASQSQQSLQQ
ncbi:MAG: hypothetical protein M1541_16285, partial [Acidobacteria bacterium]|nr:hypothetical protein [Acidobacteriota bacterium]